jgi:Flp pilus assembly protein CpaB
MENRRRRLLIMLLGVALALLAVGLVWTMGQAGLQAPEVPRERVLVAAIDVPARTELTVEHLTVRDVPQDAALPQAFTSLEEAVGLTSGVPIYAGQQITPNLFIDTQDDPIGIFAPDETIGPDTPLWRAFSITVPRERAVGGILQDGDRVDLIVSVVLRAMTSLPIFNEDGTVTYQEMEEANPIAFVTPEGEIEYLSTGVTTKVTLSDLQVLKADLENNTYVLRVDLHQAEELTQLMVDGGTSLAANQPFTFALRSQADTRAIDLDEFGETIDRIIEKYRFRVPLLIDLEELLGFPFEPFLIAPEPGEAPPPDGQPQPQPQPEPEPEPEPEPTPEP